MLTQLQRSVFWEWFIKHSYLLPKFISSNKWIMTRMLRYMEYRLSQYDKLYWIFANRLHEKDLKSRKETEEMLDCMKINMNIMKECYEINKKAYEQWHGQKTANCL